MFLILQQNFGVFPPLTDCHTLSYLHFYYFLIYNFVVLTLLPAYLCPIQYTSRSFILNNNKISLNNLINLYPTLCFFCLEFKIQTKIQILKNQRFLVFLNWQKMTDLNITK